MSEQQQPSVTAQGIAAIPAVESSRPVEERVCHDPLARRFAGPVYYYLVKLLGGYGERKAPGTIGFIVARTRCIDDYLRSRLEAGITQLVILGAGLDSRAYRLPGIMGHRSTTGPGDVRVFEVDQPATQRTKRHRVERVLGELPGQVTFVPIDFNTESLTKLCDFGYEVGQKTLFIWEGVTYYLTPEAVDSTLEFVATSSGNGSSIIFDYVYTSALSAPRRRGEIVRMQRYSRFTGERLTFGIERGTIHEFLEDRGYTDITDMSSEDLKKAYFTGVNRDRMIAPIYAVVNATVRS